MRMTDVCLVDAENPRKPVESGVLTEGPIQIFTENETRDPIFTPSIPQQKIAL